jgi:hypothetical protein
MGSGRVIEVIADKDNTFKPRLTSLAKIHDTGATLPYHGNAYCWNDSLGTNDP